MASLCDFCSYLPESTVGLNAHFLRLRGLLPHQPNVISPSVVRCVRQHTCKQILLRERYREPVFPPNTHVNNKNNRVPCSRIHDNQIQTLQLNTIPVRSRLHSSMQSQDTTARLKPVQLPLGRYSASIANHKPASLHRVINALKARDMCGKKGAKSFLTFVSVFLMIQRFFAEHGPLPPP